MKFVPTVLARYLLQVANRVKMQQPPKLLVPKRHRWLRSGYERLNTR